MYKHWVIGNLIDMHKSTWSDAKIYVPQIIYPKYSKMYANARTHQFCISYTIVFTFILTNFLVRTQEYTEIQILCLFYPWKYEKIPPIVEYFTKPVYRIVASRSTSRLVTCLGLFRLLMKGIFGTYVLWPFEKSWFFN